MSSVQVIQEYFGPVRKVTLGEFKALSSAERGELADLAAAQLGYVKGLNKDGAATYIKGER